MSKLLRKLWLRQEGLAMPLTVVIIAIVTLLGFTASFLVDNQTLMTSRKEKSESALFYAEAGINQYLWHLNKNSRFYEEDNAFIFEGGNPKVHTYNQGRFKLEITPPSTSQPVVTIKSTGWAQEDPNNKRTVQVQAKKRQFVQTVYLTGTEQSPDGDNVWWITGDEVYGPLHTNGTLRIDGDPVFHGPVTYSGSLIKTSGSAPVYEQGIEKTAQLAFPASNNQLKLQAQLNGYHYSGRTCIRLNGSQLIIRNMNVNNGAAQTMPLPNNGVIYVDGSSGSKFDINTGNVFVSGTLDGRLTIASANDIYITAKDPTNLTYSSAANTGGLSYSDNDFNPAGGITNDMLGLVAARNIEILHYDWPDNTKNGSTRYYDPVGDVAPTNITIQAALFALNRAFEYEEYDQGSVKGTIYLTGSLTQKYRGAVGTFNTRTGNPVTGYNKNYSHDPRMAYESPPHFLEPTNSGWETSNWKQQ